MKRWLAIALVVVLAVFVAACSEETPEATTTTAASGAAGDDTVYEFSFSYHSPETNSSVIYSKAWAAEIEKASNGRIKFVHYTNASLTQATETLSGTKNRTCDLAWTATAFSAHFKASVALMQPMLGWPGNADGGEIAWNAYLNNPKIQEEWSGVKVISLYPMGATSIQTTKTKIGAVDDFKGLRIRSTTAVQGAFLQALGCTPVNMPISDIYENESKNVIDGALVDLNWSNSARLWDVAKYMIDTNIFSAVGAIVMNLDAYNELPDDLKAILDEYSGLYASRLGGQMTEEFDAQFKQNIIDNGLEFYEPGPEVTTAIEQAAASSLEFWYGEMDKEGIDGKTLMSGIVADLKRLGYESPLGVE